MTSETRVEQHTPGPWHLSSIPHIPFPGTDGIPIFGRLPDGTHPRVALVKCAYGNSRADKANARLIAAAPDLLSALRDVYADLSEAEERWPTPGEILAWRDNIETAIRKATGDA